MGEGAGGCWDRMPARLASCQGSPRLGHLSLTEETWMTPWSQHMRCSCSRGGTSVCQGQGMRRGTRPLSCAAASPASGGHSAPESRPPPQTLDR